MKNRWTVEEIASLVVGATVAYLGAPAKIVRVVGEGTNRAGMTYKIIEAKPNDSQSVITGAASGETYGFLRPIK